MQFLIHFFYFALSLKLCIFRSTHKNYISLGSVFHNFKLVISSCCFYFHTPSSHLVLYSYFHLISSLWVFYFILQTLIPLALSLPPSRTTCFAFATLFAWCIFHLYFPCGFSLREICIHYPSISPASCWSYLLLIYFSLSLFLSLLALCLYFHFHFWDVGQDNRVGRAAGTSHKPVDVVQLFVVTIFSVFVFVFDYDYDFVVVVLWRGLVLGSGYF